MRTQRAIRRLKPDPVDDALVLHLIELALKAPTGSNAQSWEFVVVRDRAVKERLGDAQPPGVDPLRGPRAPALPQRPADAAHHGRRAVAGRPLRRDPGARRPLPAGHHPAAPARSPSSSLYGSIYPSVQNLLLAARAAGLGAALITLPLWSTWLARRALGLPWNVTPCAVIPLGWPRGRYGPTTRRPVGDVVHLDRYGNQPFRGRARPTVSTRPADRDHGLVAVPPLGLVHLFQSGVEVEDQPRGSQESGRRRAHAAHRERHRVPTVTPAFEDLEAATAAGPRSSSTGCRREHSRRSLSHAIPAHVAGGAARRPRPPRAARRARGRPRARASRRR